MGSNKIGKSLVLLKVKLKLMSHILFYSKNYKEKNQINFINLLKVLYIIYYII